MRCLTLARAALARGHQPAIVSRTMTPALADLVASHGVDLHRLPQTAPKEQTGPIEPALHHTQWLNMSQTTDAEQTCRVIEQEIGKPDWMVVDHYALDRQWEVPVSGICSKLLVIDDLADRTHVCDGLLDQNYYRHMEQRYCGLVPENCITLLGPDFALLRDEFSALRSRVTPRRGPVHRLLVFLGGADTQNATGTALEALVRVPSQLIPEKVDVVIGAKHPEAAALTRLCDKHSWQLHVQTNEIATLMAAADAAYGAGGTATWERCALGLPALVAVLADNQRQLAEDGHAAGFLQAPTFDPFDINAVQEQFTGFLEETARREEISRQAFRLTNGRGAAEVLGWLENPGKVPS